jgi:hypothetical protein
VSLGPGRAYPRRAPADLEAARRRSLAAVLAVRASPAGRRLVLPDGHELLRLPDGRAARLITRVDYREPAAGPPGGGGGGGGPLTRQTPDERRDPRRRARPGPLATALADAERAHARAGGAGGGAL